MCVDDIAKEKKMHQQTMKENKINYRHKSRTFKKVLYNNIFFIYLFAISNIISFSYSLNLFSSYYFTFFFFNLKNQRPSTFVEQ